MSPIRHPAAPCSVLFKGHRFDPSVLPVWVMSLLLGNLEDLGGQAGHELEEVAAFWGVLRGGQSEAQGRRHPGTGKAFPLSLSACRKPKGGSLLHAWGTLEPLPLHRGLTELRAVGTALPCHHSPPFCSPAWGPRTGPEPPTLQRVPGPPSLECIIPGGRGVGREVWGGGGGELPGRGTVPPWRGPWFPRQSPASPFLRHPPDFRGEQLLLLTSTLLSGHPFISSPPSPPPRLPRFWHSGTLQPSGGLRVCLQTQPVSSRAPCSAHAAAPPSPAGGHGCGLACG